MSVNYHAAQSRGILLDHSDAGADQWYQNETIGCLISDLLDRIRAN